MTKTRSAAALAVLAIGLLAATGAARAQSAPSDSVFQGFQRSSEYALTVDGKPVPAAEIYLNGKIPALLVLTSALPSPVLLTPRAGTVETVSVMKISRQKDGSVDLFADAVLTPAGQFQMAGEDISFTLQGKKASLVPRPPLLGPKTNADLKAYLPEYVRGARSYTPNAAAVADLKKKRSSPVTVRVFFGSWCPHCRQHVPLLLKVEDEVRNPGIRFEYFGLPNTLDAPEAKKAGIHTVPTGIVYVNGKEIGRIVGFSAPEVELDKILAAPAARGK